MLVRSGKKHGCPLSWSWWRDLTEPTSTGAILNQPQTRSLLMGRESGRAGGPAVRRGWATLHLSEAGNSGFATSWHTPGDKAVRQFAQRHWEFFEQSMKRSSVLLIPGCTFSSCSLPCFFRNPGSLFAVVLLTTQNKVPASFPLPRETNVMRRSSWNLPSLFSFTPHIP